MTSENSRKGANFYDENEVEQAIRALSSHDKKKLDAAAWTLTARLGLDRVGRDHEDLLADAFLRTLNGSRAWKRGVDLVRHLTETMRSISWTWWERQQAEAKVGKAEVWEEGSADHESAAKTGPDAEARLVVAHELWAVMEYFADDYLARQVIACWQMGLDGTECCDRKGLSDNELRAAIRRIRRYAQRRRAESGAIDAN